MNLARFFLVLFAFASSGRAQEISSEIRVQQRSIGSNASQKYFLIERKNEAETNKARGLILILPGGSGNADFLPFCANVLTLYGIPSDFVVAELIAPEWSKDENRVVWPSKAFPDLRAKFTSEDFVAAVVDDVSSLRNIDERFVFTLGWSSSGHVLYSASAANKKIRGSIIAMSHFLPGRVPNLEQARGKNYFLYHSPEDQVCPFADARMAERTLKEHGAKVKLVTYKGGHGWVPNTYYCDRIKEGIEWLKTINSDPDGSAMATSPTQVETKRPAKPEVVTRLTPPERGFFSKQLTYHGIPIKAHADVEDKAFWAAYDRLELMLGKLPNAISKLNWQGAELHIIGRNQATSDLPEWREKKGKPFDGDLTIDQRTRGMGGRMASCGEENLLKLDQDRYRGRDICVHEFSHCIAECGLGDLINKKIVEQYHRSLARGKWKKSYAATNPSEFFAELAMWYFGTHGDMGMEGAKPEPGPKALRDYDPEGFELMDEIFSGRAKPPLMSSGWISLEPQPIGVEGELRSGRFDHFHSRSISEFHLRGIASVLARFSGKEATLCQDRAGQRFCSVHLRLTCLAARGRNR
jgi:predicted esterase